MVPVTVPATKTSLGLVSRGRCYAGEIEGEYVLDVRNDHGSGLGGKLAQALEAESAADRGDIGERLEDVGVADRVTVVEQNHRRRDGFTRHDSRDNMGLGVRDVGSKGSGSLESISITPSTVSKY